MEQRLAAARLWAATRMPYLASALFATQVRSQPGCGTVAVTERWVLTADPAVVAELDVPDLGRLLLHLTCHALRDHAERARRVGATTIDGGRGRWNRCTDAEVNDDLVAVNCLPPTAPDLPADLGCAAGQLAELYWSEASDGVRHWDCGPGADGSDPGAEGDDGLAPHQAELLRHSVAAEVQRTAGQEPGRVPAGLVRWAEAVLPSRVDWRRVLAAEVRRSVAAVAGQVDYTYRRPSRRAAAVAPAVLPSLYRPVPHVAIVCDTSSSMHDQLLCRALVEVEALLVRAGLRQTQVHVLAVDTDVRAVRRVTRARDVVLTGGGGTDMGAGIAAALALRPRPAVVVVLTDGFTPWPERPPRGVRVVVGLLTARNRPTAAPAWARTVVIEE